MTIIRTAAVSGLHRIESQSHRTTVWMDGYTEVPKHLESAVWASGGYCDLIIENGVLVGVTPTEKPVPEPAPPTELEQLRADVDFIAAMGGIEL